MPKKTTAAPASRPALVPDDDLEFDDGEPEMAPPTTPVTEVAPAVRPVPEVPPVAIEVPSESIVVTVPIDSKDAVGHLSLKVEARLTHNQARTLKRLFNRLHRTGAQRANGQHVDRLGHAVQWLLDQLAAPVPAPPA